MQHIDDFPIETDGFLTVRIAGSTDRAERILLVGRPHDGLVHVREWTTHSFNSAGEDFDIEPGELLADIESAAAAGLGLAPELYQIRLWLGG